MCCNAQLLKLLAHLFMFLFQLLDDVSGAAVDARLLTAVPVTSHEMTFEYRNVCAKALIGTDKQPSWAVACADRKNTLTK